MQAEELVAVVLAVVSRLPQACGGAAPPVQKEPLRHVLQEALLLLAAKYPGEQPTHKQEHARSSGLHHLAL